MRKLLGSILAVIVVSGCTCGGEPCDPNTDVSRCEGNTVVYCPQPGVDQFFGANQWRRQDCAEISSVCVTNGGSVFCALAAEPNSACDGGTGNVCENATTRLACQEGFGTSRTDCLSCETGDAGVECHGSFGTTCTSSSECVQSLQCGSKGFCSVKDAG